MGLFRFSTLKNTTKTNPQGLALNNNGTKMYATGDFGDDVNEYNLK